MTNPTPTHRRGRKRKSEYDIISVPTRLHMADALKELATLIESANPKLHCTLYAALATAVEEAVASRKSRR